MPDYRETVIRIDHGQGFVEIWTQDRATLRKLDKAKAPLSEPVRNEEWRRVPIERFRWRILGKILKRQATPAQLAALTKAREKRNVA